MSFGIRSELTAAAAKYVAEGYKVSIGDDDPRYAVVAVEVSTKVAARGAGADAVANELGSLSINDAPVVYEAEWRTKVQFETETDEGQKAVTTASSESVSWHFTYTADFRPPPHSRRTSTSSRRPSNPPRRTSSSAVSAGRSSRSKRSSTCPYSSPSYSRVSASRLRAAYSFTVLRELVRRRSRAQSPRRHRGAAALS